MDPASVKTYNINCITLPGLNESLLHHFYDTIILSGLSYPPPISKKLIVL